MFRSNIYYPCVEKLIKLSNLVALYGTTEKHVQERYYELIAKELLNLLNLHSPLGEEINKNLILFFPTLRANVDFPKLFALLFYKWVIIFTFFFCKSFIKICDIRFFYKQICQD